MSLATEKAIWRSRKARKTELLIGYEQRLHSFRRSDLVKDTIKHISLHTGLARERYFDKFSYAAWEEVDKYFEEAEKKRKAIQQRRRRREQSLAAAAEEVRKAREEAETSTGAQKIACLRRVERAYKKLKHIKSKIEASAVVDQEFFTQRRESASTALPKDQTSLRLFRTEMSAFPFPTVTKHVAYNNGRNAGETHSGNLGESTVSVPVLAPNPGSTARRRSEPLPPLVQGLSFLADPVAKLPEWANCLDSPLSSPQVEYGEEQMKSRREYSNTGRSQRVKAVAGDIPVALRSMTRAYKRALELSETNSSQMNQTSSGLKGVGQKTASRSSIKNAIDISSSHKDSNLTGEVESAKRAQDVTAQCLRVDKGSDRIRFEITQDTAQENWHLVSKFATGRQLYPPKRSHFAALLSSTRTRDIATRPRVKFVADRPKNVRLLIVHITGIELPVPCNSCASGHGPFKKCIAISKQAAGETTCGIVCCTNCATDDKLQRKCNVEELLRQPIRRGREVAAPGSTEVNEDKRSVPDAIAMELDTVSVDDGELNRHDGTLLPVALELSRTAPRRWTNEAFQAKINARKVPTSQDGPIPVNWTRRSNTARRTESQLPGRLLPETSKQAEPNISSHEAKLDYRFAFGVHVIPYDGSLLFDSEPSNVRLCSLMTGKIAVNLQGHSPFIIGPGGIFQLMTGMCGQIMNVSEVDAVLHVSTVKR